MRMKMDYFNDIQFRVAARQIFLYDSPAPFIPGYNSLEFIRSGHILLERNRVPVELKAGTLFWMNKNGTYRFRVFKEHLPCEHFYVDFIGARTDRIISCLDEICPEGHISSYDPDLGAEIFDNLVKSYRSDPVANHIPMAVDVERLTAHIVRSIDPPVQLKGISHEILLAAEDIRKDPFKGFDLAHYTAKAGISSGHFRRLFHASYQMSPSDYRHDQQMIRIEELLRNTDLRVKEIVFTCRFDSLSYFSHVFKKYSGMSPRDYRKKYKKKGN